MPSLNRTCELLAHQSMGFAASIDTDSADMVPSDLGLGYTSYYTLVTLTDAQPYSLVEPADIPLVVEAAFTSLSA